ncbi:MULTISPECIES: hypothetical protein [unclassified Micromonospora]|uniref:hypothetical protein n=1 Tax=unclassified Micromonospora TaxID=2617518 RepID=UPI00332397A7
MTNTTATIINGDVTGRIDPRAPYQAAGDALIERLRVMGELPAELDGATEDRIRQDAAVVADAAVRVERARIRRNLSLPLLQAMRVIPSGRIQQGCVISDGTIVRERMRDAYFGITADPTLGDQQMPATVTDRDKPLDLVEVGRWLEQCGHCDAGLPQACTCPPGDIRAVLSRAVDEIVVLRRELNQEATA